jgi:glycosyltransferase involved in cell wall biosynthesis
MSKRLVICSQYPPMRYGIAVAAQRHALGLHALGWDVEVVTTTSAAPEIPVAEPFPVHRNCPPRRIMEICRAARAVIVEGDALVYLLPVAASGTPFIVVHHGQRAARPWRDPQLDPEEISPVWRAARYVVVRHYLRKARLNVSVSQRSADLLRLPNPVVIPSPIAGEAFPEISLSDLQDDRRNRLGFLGRLSAEKGADAAIRILAGLQDETVRLDIYGDGPQQRHIEELADSLGVRCQVVFHGFVNGAGLNAAYRNLRCVLVPSTWEEPFCMVAAESMYCGTPVIGSNLGGLPTTIGPGGRCHPIDDVEAWIADTRRLLDCDDFHAQLAERGRCHVLGNFMTEIVIRQFDHYLQRLVDGVRGIELARRRPVLESGPAACR